MTKTIAFIFLVLLVSAAWAGNPAKFVVTADWAGPEFVGCGVEMHPYVYCEPNWPEKINEKNAPEYEKKLIEMGPQHVRIFAEYEWWQADRAKPERKESFFKVVELAKRAGATVNMTMWHGPYYPSVKATAEAFADGVYEAIEKRGLTNVQYVTLQNEVNYTWIKPPMYIELYRAFDQALKDRGIRQKIKIVGGDLVSEHQVMWLGELAENLNDVLDGYSTHQYSEYWDSEHMLKRIAEVPMIVSGLQKEQQKPLYLTEFNCYGHHETVGTSGTDEFGTPLGKTKVLADFNAWLMLEGINRGYVAMLAWEDCDFWYGAGHKRPMHGLIRGPDENFELTPMYHLMRMFTHSTAAGWRAVKVRGDWENQSAACMKGPKAEMAVFVQNRGKESHEIEIEGLPSNMQFQLQIFDGTMKKAADVTADEKGMTTVKMAAATVGVLTTASQDK